MKQYDFSADLRWFIDNQDDLVAQYNGKIIAHTLGYIWGVYDDMCAAYSDQEKQGRLGAVTIRSISPGKSAYSVQMSGYGIKWV